MCEGVSPDPISDDEILYRLASERSNRYDPESGVVAWEAFMPNRNDTDGLSFQRAKYVTPKEVVSQHPRAKPGLPFYVFAMRADDLRRAGVIVDPSPRPGDPGHASLSNITIDLYEEDKNRIRELASLLAAEAVCEVLGPFEKE